VDEQLNLAHGLVRAGGIAGDQWIDHAAYGETIATATVTLKECGWEIPAGMSIGDGPVMRFIRRTGVDARLRRRWSIIGSRRDQGKEAMGEVRLNWSTTAAKFAARPSTDILEASALAYLAASTACGV